MTLTNRKTVENSENEELKVKKKIKVNSEKVRVKSTNSGNLEEERTCTIKRERE